MHKSHLAEEKALIGKQNESNKKIKQYERKQKGEIVIDEDIDLGRVFELAKTTKIYVNSLNLHEITNESFLEYKYDFELIGSLLIGEIEQRRNIRFKILGDFETYIDGIDDGYDAEDFIFTGWLYKLNTPEFNKVNRSQYERDVDFKQDIVQSIGNNYCNPTSSNCFIKSNKYFTSKDYTVEILTLIELNKEDLT